MKPEILAHRTGSLTAPNSIKGIKTCFWMEADSVECDITFVEGNGSQKIPVVWADAKNGHLDGYRDIHFFEKIYTDAVNRLKGRFDTTLSSMHISKVLELDRTDLPHEGIQTIEDIWKFLEVYRGMKIFFDIKYYLEDIFGHYNKIPSYLIDLTVQKIVRPAIAKNLCQQIGFVTFFGGAELLKAVKRESPQIHTDLITIFPWTKFAHHLEYLDSLTIGWDWANGWLWSISDKKLEGIIKEVKSKGVKIYGGHANTEESVLWLLRKNFDGIWTDDIQLAMNTIRTFNKQKRRGNE